MRWLARWLGGAGSRRRDGARADDGAVDDDAPSSGGSADEDEDDELDDGALDPEVVELPIEDSIDLHPFQPREIRDVVRAYLDEAWERGFDEVRIIHGRGIGQQRQAVRTLLERDPRVVSFGDAGQERGGWGATVARFAERPAGSDEPKP